MKRPIGSCMTQDDAFEMEGTVIADELRRYSSFVRTLKELICDNTRLTLCDEVFGTPAFRDLGISMFLVDETRRHLNEDWDTPVTFGEVRAQWELYPFSFIPLPVIG